eukprot:11275583-Alexandrium_andersonii.AAC.1
MHFALISKTVDDCPAPTPDNHHRGGQCAIHAKSSFARIPTTQTPPRLLQHAPWEKQAND